MRATPNAAPIAAFEGGEARAEAAVEHYDGELEWVEQAVTDAAAELGLEDANL